MLFPAPGTVELRAADGVNAPAPGQVHVRTQLSLISTGTERTVLGKQFEEGNHWSGWVRYPFAPGYSCLGTVAVVGDGVAGLRVGDRVVVRASHASDHVVDAARCVVVPDGVGNEAAVWFALGKIAFVGALLSGLGLGAHVLVVGAGPVGQMAVRWAVAAGCAEVVVADLAEERLGLAVRGGASAVVTGPLGENVDGIERAFDGRRPDIVIDSTGHAATFADALRVVADRGRVVLLGDTGSPTSQHLTGDVIRRNITIVGAHELYTDGDSRWDGDRDIVRLFLRLAASGRFGTDGLVTHRFRPQDASAAYQLVATAGGDVMGIVFDWTVS